MAFLIGIGLDAGFEVSVPVESEKGSNYCRISDCSVGINKTMNIAPVS
jgi:hypothetical protein